LIIFKACLVGYSLGSFGSAYGGYGGYRPYGTFGYNQDREPNAIVRQAEVITQLHVFVCKYGTYCCIIFYQNKHVAKKGLFINSNVYLRALLLLL